MGTPVDQYQNPLTKSLSDKLYDLSVGNLDLAMRVYKEAQRQVIGSGDERINESVLEHAANITIRASKKSVDKIKRDNKLTLLKRKKIKKICAKYVKSDNRKVRAYPP